VTVARWLSVSAPAWRWLYGVCAETSWWKLTARAGISLTASGRRVSDKLRLRHHLVERMLHEMLGVEWYKVHDEAERLEHAISEDVERRLIDKLGAAGPARMAIKLIRTRGTPQVRPPTLVEAPPGSLVRVESVDERIQNCWNILIRWASDLALR